MFDVPDTTPINSAEPVTAHEVFVKHEEPGDLPLTITPDVSLVSGGTAVMPGSGAVAAGGLPQPWNGSVTHADRQLGATRGAATFLR